METILKIKDITKSYNEFTLDHVSITLPKGCIMGFIGENGAGKTTTIKAILNLLHLDHGSIEIFGKDMRQYEKACKEEIGIVLSDSLFPENMTCISIHNVLKNIYKNWDKETFFSYCTRFNLPLHKRNKEFSRGMKMKLLIACALSHKPKLLILDEATSGLDPVVRDEILDVFLDFIQDAQHSIFLSSHITSDIEKVADYVTFIHKGQILLSEAKDEMLATYAILKANELQFSSLVKDDYVGYRKGQYSINVLVKDRQAMKRRFPDAVFDRASLEDILLYMVKGERKL